MPWSAIARERLGVCGPLGSGARLVPATNLGVKLLTVFAANPIVHGPAMLRRLGEIVCLEHFGHLRHRTRPVAKSERTPIY